MKFESYPPKILIRRTSGAYVSLADKPGTDGFWFSNGPMSRQATIDELLKGGWHQQDIGDALAEADAYAEKHDN